MKTNTQQHESKLTRRQKLALIEKAYACLDSLNNISWTPYRDRLCRMNLEEERDHRSGDFSRFHDAVSAQVVARLFTVKWLADYMAGTAWIRGKRRMPTVKDVLGLKPSCIYAAAIVANYRKEIRKAWRGLDVAELAALDYTEFVRVKEAA